MSYFIAVIGVLLIVPWPVFGGLLVACAVWMHHAGLVNPISEVGELLLFYAAIGGILCVCFL